MTFSNICSKLLPALTLFLIKKRKCGNTLVSYFHFRAEVNSCLSKKNLHSLSEEAKPLTQFVHPILFLYA